MTLKKLHQILESTGIPTVYYSWSTQDGDRPSLPFICYNTPFSSNFFADNIVFLSIEHVQIELYTKYKEPTIEAALERVLAENEIAWEKTETYLDSENCFQIIYETEV